MTTTNKTNKLHVSNASVKAYSSEEIQKKFNWEHAASDFNAPFFRNYIWTKAFYLYEKEFGFPIFAVGTAGSLGDMEYIADLTSWKACHEVFKERVLADNDIVDWVIDETFRLGEAFNAWSQKEIFDKDLRESSAEEIITLMQTFIEKQSELYAYGVLLPVLDFQGFSFVEGELNKILETKAPAEKKQAWYGILTTPRWNSFQQDQEEDLLRLMKDFEKRDGWKEAIMNNDLDKLHEFFSDFMCHLDDHTKKHGWVYYVYAGPAYTQKEFLGFIQDYITKNIDPSTKLKELAERQKKIADDQEHVITALTPTPFEESILRLASKVVYGKPRRKDYQSKSYYHVEKLHREIGNRLGLSLQEVRFCLPQDLEAALLGKEVIDKQKIMRIMERYVCLPDGQGGVQVLFGEKGRAFYATIEHEEEETAQVDELKGMCACAGEATGKVKVINKPEEMEKMEYGDILVSVATTPSIVPAMKKAAAIVTDEGGLTCHAAIVSRELDIPCVVGLKVVTKTFKDGETIFVDATKGLVKRQN